MTFPKFWHPVIGSAGNLWLHGSQWDLLRLLWPTTVLADRFPGLNGCCWKDSALSSSIRPAIGVAPKPGEWNQRLGLNPQARTPPISCWASELCDQARPGEGERDSHSWCCKVTQPRTQMEDGWRIGNAGEVCQPWCESTGSTGPGGRPMGFRNIWPCLETQGSFHHGQTIQIVNTLAEEQDEPFPYEQLKIPAGYAVRERMPQGLSSRDGGVSNLHLPFCLPKLRCYYQTKYQNLPHVFMSSGSACTLERPHLEALTVIRWFDGHGTVCHYVLWR